LLAALSALSALLIGAAVANGAGLGAPAAQAGQVVEVGDFWFCNSGDAACHTTDADDIDSAVTIAAGGTVQWNWVGQNQHSVTACSSGSFASCGAAQAFDSGFKSSGTFSQTFSQAGTFYYRCEAHPNDMHGQVTVTAASTGGGAQLTAPASGITQIPRTGGAPSASDGMPWGLLIGGIGGAMVLAGAGLALKARRG
jgi:plastocyanin